MKALLLAGLAFAAPASPAPERLDEVLARHFRARGGLERIKAVQTVRLSGHMAVGPGMDIPFVLELKRPRQMRMDLETPEGTATRAIDGSKGWGMMPGGRPEPLPLEAVREAEAQADMDGPLVDHREKGHKVAFAGRDRFGGAEAYKLNVTLKNGDARTIWLDADTLLEIGSEARREDEAGEEVFETRFSDYRPVDGLMVAHRFEAGPKGTPQRQQMVIEKVELNAPIEDARFQLPPSPRP